MYTLRQIIVFVLPIIEPFLTTELFLVFFKFGHIFVTKLLSQDNYTIKDVLIYYVMMSNSRLSRLILRVT